MTTIKHNFSELSNYNNPIVAAYITVNNATGGWLSYLILGVLFGVATYVIVRKTNDIGKSIVTSMYIITILSMILFYMGKVGNVLIISELFLLSVVVITAIGTTILYFTRMKDM